MEGVLRPTSAGDYFLDGGMDQEEDAGTNLNSCLFFKQDIADTTRFAESKRAVIEGVVEVSSGDIASVGSEGKEREQVAFFSVNVGVARTVKDPATGLAIYQLKEDCGK